MLAPSYLKQTKFETPPIGEDWLWWHPDVPDYDWRLVLNRRFSCDLCDVRWEQDLSEKNVILRCFCCGRFVRRPKI